MGYGYSIDALVYDSSSNSWSLRPDYDLTQHRIEISITDNDGYLDGDFNADEVGDDSTQIGTVSDTGGNPIAAGQVYSEMYYELSGPGGGTSYMDVIEIAGQPVGFLVTAPLEQGASYTQVYAGNVHTYSDNPYVGDTRIMYSELQSVPCFGPGTHLMTTAGEVPVEWLATGDTLVTRDHGAQPVLWIGRYRVTLADMADNPALIPCAILPGAVQPGLPDHPLLLSGQHRVLLSGYDTELYFGADEVFAPVAHLLGSVQVELAPQADAITFTHVLLQNHEVVLANGLWVESLFLGAQVEPALARQIPAPLLADPKLASGHRETARPCLKRWECALLAGDGAGARPALTSAAA